MKLISWPENHQCEVRQLNNQTNNAKKRIHCHHSPVRLFTVKYSPPPSNKHDKFAKVTEVIFPVFLPILGLSFSKGYLLVWDVTQGKLVVNYRRFGTSFRLHSQGSTWVPSSRVKLEP